MIPGASTSRSRTRRGVAVAALVLVLALINIVVIGTLAAGGDESEEALTRVESLRAFYASESGARVALRCLNSGLTPPAEGASFSLGTAQVRYAKVPTQAGPGTIVIEGVSGSAIRRTQVVIDSK
jgi:hypothetical protein